MLPSTLRAATREPGARRAGHRVQNLRRRRISGRHAADGYDLCDTTHCQVYRPRAAGEGPADAGGAGRRRHARAGPDVSGPRDPGALPRRLRRPHGVRAHRCGAAPTRPISQSVEDWFCSRQPGVAAGRSTPEETAAAPRAECGPAHPDRASSRRRRDRVARRRPAARSAVTLTGSTQIVGAGRGVPRRHDARRSGRGRSAARGSRWPATALASASPAWASATASASARPARCGASRPGSRPAEILAHYFPGTRLQTASAARVRPDVVERLFAGERSRSAAAVPNLPSCRTLRREPGIWYHGTRRRAAAPAVNRSPSPWRRQGQRR